MCLTICIFSWNFGKVVWKKKKIIIIIAESLIQFIPKYTLYVENYIESKISIIGKYKPTFQCFT